MSLAIDCEPSLLIAVHDQARLQLRPSPPLSVKAYSAKHYIMFIHSVELMHAVGEKVLLLFDTSYAYTVRHCMTAVACKIKEDKKCRKK